MKRAHFIGIAGKGMSAVALMLKQTGWHVTGSDSGAYPPVSTYLDEQNIPYSKSYSKDNIPEEVDVVIIGKNAKLTKEINEEVREAHDRGLTIKSFPEILKELIGDKETIIVAGSYGKSTTTSLITWCLVHAQKDPSYFIGEISQDLPAHGHIGNGKYFVLEGDEYPSSNWDNSSKFLHYKPRNVVLTSAVHDHINIFPTHEGYLEPFKKLISLIPEDGLLVTSEELFAKKLGERYDGQKIQYGFGTDSEWGAKNIHYSETTTFDLTRNDKKLVTIETSILGKHNVENILAAAALLLTKEIITLEEFRSAVKEFRGVKRRLELLTKNSSVRVYEGFGSSYEKAQTAYEALSLHFPKQRVLTIFEPHTFSWRNRAYVKNYDSVFKTSSKVFVYEPPMHGVSTHDQLTQEEIVDRIKASGTDAEDIHSKEEAIKKIEQVAQPGDIIMLMTSGDLGGIIESLPPFIESKFENHENI